MRALVTGCGRRLGFYLCEQLVAAGWQVTGSYRSERPELARLAALGVEAGRYDTLAAARPAPGDTLYFVATGNGERLWTARQGALGASGATLCRGRDA